MTIKRYGSPEAVLGTYFCPNCAALDRAETEHDKEVAETKFPGSEVEQLTEIMEISSARSITRLSPSNYVPYKRLMACCTGRHHVEEAIEAHNRLYSDHKILAYFYDKNHLVSEADAKEIKELFDHDIPAIERYKE